MKISSESLDVEVHPAHGAVISSIRSTQLARNILWQQRDPDLDAPLSFELGPAGEPSIDSFDQDLLIGGWFPMFPTVGPPGNVRSAWMHGEAPRIPWDVLERSPSMVKLATTTPVSACRLSRTISVRGNRVSVQMSIRNDSTHVLAVAMGEHPCFPRDLFADGSISIEAAEGATRSVADPRNSTLPPNSTIGWPMDAANGAGHDASVVPSHPDGRHDHIVFRPRSGRATISAPHAGFIVTLEWERPALPSVMLWQHFRPPGSRLNADVFALELVSTGWRTHEESVDHEELVPLNVGETTSYSLHMTVEHLE